VTDTREMRGMSSGLLIVMFLFGGALGYIVRDLRADAEVKQLAASARRDVEQAAVTAVERAQQVGSALGHGVTATAESTKAALTESTHPRDSATQAKKAPAVAKGR